MSDYESFPYKDLCDKYPVRILVVDDRPEDLTTMSIFLESMSYTASYAMNGVEAIETLEAGVYDLIFMDVQMPKMGGVEATQLIRKGEKEVDVGIGAYIVGFSGYDEESIESDCLGAGMNGYFHKPIELDNLAKIIEACAEWMKVGV